MALHVELVSPEKILYEGEAQMVVCRTAEEGDVAFLTGHAPLLGLLVEWPVKIRPVEGDDVLAAVHGGFVEVSDDRVTILSDLAELASEIDLERARATKEWAEARLREEHDASVEAVLRRSHARIELCGQLGH